MIAVVVPVHNEDQLLFRCLASILQASRDPALEGEEVKIFVVLDACTDRSEQIASGLGVETVVCDAKNVGRARALGAKTALAAGARWLAFTDGDSEVPAKWLSLQLALRTDAVCGIVSVRDWTMHSPIAKRRYLSGYQAKDGHRHIHGANFGVTATAYQKAGGFLPVEVHEDVALVEALEKSGAMVAWVASPCVLTDGRTVGRLLGGFAGYLRRLAMSAPETAKD